jgi:hypothetical protein
MRERYRHLNVDWNQLVSPANIRDTVNAVRGRLLNTAGHVRLFVHSRCTVLIDQLKNAEWPSKDNLKNYHALAALRYYLYALYGQSSGTISVASASMQKADMARFSSRYNP